MKKVLMMAAFVGLLTSSAVASTYGDDKGKKDKKECAKSCCKAKAENGASTTKATDKK